MFKKKQAMKRGGAVKKRGGGMMGPKKKRAGGIMKKRGGGMMEKMMGGGMMGPKKKMAKGGPIAKPLAKKPTGRDAAAKKAAMKGVENKGRTMIAKFKQGKGNPAGKDMSLRGKIRDMTLAKLKRTPQGAGRKNKK